MCAVSGTQVSKALRLLSWFGAFSGVAIPGYSTFFRNMVPPLFPEIGWITAGLGAATVFAVYSLRPRANTTSGRKRLVRRGLFLIGTSLLLLIAFLVSLRALTVRHPRGIALYQTGFRTARWSLTEAGQKDLDHLPSATPEDLMFMEAAFSTSGPTKIWRAWSIYAAGLILLAFYLGGFVGWTSGFTTLAVAGESTITASSRTIK